ncbi:MAG: hypothetical protein R3F56_03440 [Planctomycetota bacterium]
MTDHRAELDPVTSRRACRAAAVLLLLLPAALLWPSLLGREVYLPFSAATFPPFRAELDAGLLERLDTGANMDVTEIPITFIPELTFVRSELAAGRLPHWNPYARFGAALLSTSVVGLMYPPNWLTFLAVDPTHGLAWNAYLALAIAGLLMFGFLRSLSIAPLAATFGAIAFALSGTLSANLHFYQRVHALVWLPGMLWALTRMDDRRGAARMRAGVGLALCLAMSWLAGFPAYAAAGTLVAGGWAVWLAGGRARRQGAGDALRLLLLDGAFAGLGMALAAVQLLPMFAFFPESNRDPDPTADSIASQAFDPMGFLGYALPDPFGTPANQALPYDSSLLSWSMFSRAGWTDGVLFRPNYNFVEYTVYPGVLVLLLALLGLVGRRAAGRAFAAIALLVLFALACAGPLTSALNDLPFVRSVPPLRFLGPGCALVALLAARGFQQAAQVPVRARLLAGIALLGLVACVVGRWILGTRSPDAWLAHLTPTLLDHYRPRFPNVTPEMVQGLLGHTAAASIDQARCNLNYGIMAFAAAALWLLALPSLARRSMTTTTWLVVGLAGTAAELLCFALPVNRGRPDAPLAAPALDLLRRERDAHADRGGFVVARAARVPQLPQALPPCLLVPERIRDLHAYTFVDARSHRLFTKLYGPDHMIRGYWPMAFPDDERLQRPLFDLLGVRYVLASLPGDATAGLSFAGDEVAVGGDPSFHVYERPTALPRAFVVPSLRTLPDEEAVIAAMVAPDLAPRREALVLPDQAARLHGHAGAAGAEGRAVRFVMDTPTELRLHTDAGPPGFLVVSDALMRGWTATADGREVDLARGNLFMRILPLGPEATEVRFTYFSPRLGLGTGVTVLAALALAFLALRGRRAVPDRIPAPPPPESTPA